MTAKTASKSEEEAQPALSNLFVETVKVALYAEYGKRKTEQISTLIREFGVENVLVVSAEKGLNTIRTALTIPANVIVANNYDELRSEFPKVQAFATGSDKYIALDGGSRVVEWLANEQLAGADRFYEATKRNLPVTPNDLQYGRFMQKGEINSMAVYGRVGRDSERLWNTWIGLNANLYVNFLEDKVGQSGFEKTFPYGPDVPGRVGLKAVMSSFDYVGRLFYNEAGQLVAGFDPKSYTYMARTREDRALVQIPAEIADFNLARFIKLVRGEIET